jgi:hypothetical protein
MAWLGFPPATIRPQEIREAFKTATREKSEQYVEDIARLLVSAANTTLDGGTVAVMIGDTVLRGEYLQIVRRVLDRLPPALCLQETAVRVPRHTEATWVTSQRRNGQELGAKLYDFILTFSVSH